MVYMSAFNMKMMQAVILFVVVSNAISYNITNTFTSAVGFPIASPSGCPYWSGLLLHGLLFVYLLDFFVLQITTYK